MAGKGSEERWLTEVGALRVELAEMRKEQQELARAVRDLAETFKSLAMHLGIASEPYRRAGTETRDRDLRGFG